MKKKIIAIILAGVLLLTTIITLVVFIIGRQRKENFPELDISNSGWNNVDSYGIEKVVETPTFTVDETVEEGSTELFPFAFFSNGMVLQRNSVNRVFGTCNYDGGVAVEICGKKYYGQAKDGSFEVYLPPIEQGKDLQMIIYGRNGKITIKDVCFGEVILFSGQSNMEWRISYTTDNTPGVSVPGKQYLTYNGVFTSPYIPTLSNDPDTYKQYVGDEKLSKSYVNKALEQISEDEDIRLMLLDNGLNTAYQIGKNEEPRSEYDVVKVWKKADSNTIKQCSMFAYYFAQNLRNFTDVPVGVIVAAVGATSATTWVDRETYDRNLTLFPNTGDTMDQYSVSRCYNTYIAPMLKYKFGSYVWYQGEAECISETYTQAFSLLVESYRAKTDNPNMKVLVVSLPQFGDGALYPTGYSQEKYAKASKEIGLENSIQTIGRANQQKLPSVITNCAVSVSVNTGDFDDIHPSDKTKIAYQAVCSYLTDLYAFKDQAILYPEVDRVEKIGDQLKISFKNLGDGLNLKNNGIGFQVSKDGRVYRQVKAIKDGECVILKGSDVKLDAINYVRYGYLQFPRISRVDASKYVSIFNSYGLPLDQFELDLTK